MKKKTKFVERFGIWESILVVCFLLLVLFISSRFGILFGLVFAMIGITLWRRWLVKWWAKKNEVNRKTNKN